MAFGYSPQEHNRAMNRLMADINALPPVKCVQCGGESHGSKWSDGSVVRSVCQRCKDEADAQAERNLRATVRALDYITPLRERIARQNSKTKPCPICNGTMTFSPAEQDCGDHTGWNVVRQAAQWGCENPDCEHVEVDDE